jgi:hypothetical protein
MKSPKALFAITAIAMAGAAPLAQAAVGDVYISTPFQGVTFTFTELTATRLSFELAGSLGGDWSTATSLGAFDLKDIGLDFSASGGATATIFSGPGAAGLVGINDQMNNSADCTAAGAPKGSICFDINPDVAVSSPFDMTYVIDFNKAMFIGDTGPHLQIAFTNSDPCPGGKPSCAIGSLYSKNVPQTSSQSTNSTGIIPEPNSSALAVLALALLGGGFWTRRRS